MPNYEYTCTKCENVFDAMVPYEKRDEHQECPECGARESKRGVAMPRMSYSGIHDMYKRAGDGWKEVQQKIKKGSGRRNTIRTK
jgi:putative FmdB family regulatory protein